MRLQGKEKKLPSESASVLYTTSLDEIFTMVKRAVVIDDKVLMGAEISDILTYSGFEVKSWKDPQEALKYILENKENIDIIFTDYDMPELDGPALIKKIRAEGYEQPIVVLTADLNKERSDAAHKAGASKVYGKMTFIQYILPEVYRKRSDETLEEYL